MKITENFEIIKRKNGDWTTIIDGVDKTSDAEEWVNTVREIYTKAMHMTPLQRAEMVRDEYAKFLGKTSDEVEMPKTEKEILIDGLDNLMKFFTEFQFEPNFRFVNTLAYHIQKSQTSAKNFVASYFELTDNPFTNEVREKMKSAEFNGILKNIKSVSPKEHINNRFKIYYGSAGTGKTTLALTETDNRCIVCNASMLPSDLMEDFVFVDGKADFQPSALWNCMTEGKKIVLDEINLLPFDSLRFLQGVLDGKKEFIYKGRTITIADGFEIIGTMNLAINGMVYGLPEPLIDRCSDLEKFTLDATTLARAIL